MENSDYVIKKIRLSQYGSNCGIYAIVFSINLYLAKQDKPLLSKREMRRFIADLTEAAVKPNQNNQRYSIVGEFFNMETYKKFINSIEAQRIISQYVPSLSIAAELVDKERFLTKREPILENESLILPYGTSANTHIVPVIDISEQNVVRYLNARKLRTGTLSDFSLSANFKVKSYRRKRLFDRPIITKDYAFIVLLLFLPLLYLSLIKNLISNPFISVFFVASLSLFLGYSFCFIIMNLFKVARHSEMRIELANHKCLTDIPEIKLHKLIKLKFIEQLKGI